MDNNSGSQVSMRSLPALLTDLSDTEQRFLSGTRDRGRDLESAVRIFLEFLRGFEFFGNIDRPCVTVFGSARFAPGHRYYEMARHLGSQLALAGYGVMTGGGPGIMEAANRGAREAGGLSLGCNIILPKEQHANPYLDRFIEMDHFFVRKVMLVKYSRARGNAGRRRHAGRGVRNHHAGAMSQAGPFPDCGNGLRVLGRNAQLRAQDSRFRTDHQSGGSRLTQRYRFPGTSRCLHKERA